MKKLIYIISVLTLFVKISNAQDFIEVSMNQAIKLGIKNRNNIKADSLNVLIYKSIVKEKQKYILPDLSLKGNLTYYGDREKTTVPAGLLGNTEPEKIKLGTNNNTCGALDLNYTLYKPGLYTDINIAKNNNALADEKLNQTKCDIKHEITKAYYEMALKKVQYEIMLQEEHRYKSYYELIKGKFENGATLQNDFDQATLDYKNASINTQKSKQLYELSCINLKYKMNIPANTNVEFTDSIESLKNLNNMPMSKNLIADRTEIKQLVIENKGNRLQLMKAKENYLPTITFFANYSQYFQSNYFDYSNSFNWSPVNYVGIQVSIPIMQTIKNHELVKQSKLKIAQTNELISQETNDIQNEITSASIELQNAELNEQTSMINYNLAQSIYDRQKQQFQIGTLQYQDLLNTEKSIHNAQQNYISSAYDLLLAKLKYEIAGGR
ncbi:MAG: TolC family protein [Bacteroidaceae bacterium]|nr:TolC family protein [Bacteroidaceae bacterium]